MRKKITQFLAICGILLTTPLFALYASADETTPAVTEQAAVSATDSLTTPTEVTTTVTTTTTFNSLERISYSANEYGITIDRYAWISEENVNIPAEIDGKPVTKIGEHAFQYCFASEVILPDTVTEIADSAFEGCRYLKQIKIPENCIRIGARAFAKCSALATAEIPSVIENIGDSAFDGTPFVSSTDGIFVYLGEKILYSYRGADANVVLPEGITCIAAHAFANHPELVRVELPASVNCIQSGAFDGCTALETIDVHGTLTDVARNAFESTKWFGSNNEDFLTLGKALIAYRGSAYEVAVPDGVSVIGCSAFEDCKTLSKITLPVGVTDICRNAFNGCTALQIAELPDTVKRIGDRAFFGCSSLAYLETGDALEQIGKQAFLSCDALKELYLPDTVTRIDSQAIGYRVNTDVLESIGGLVLFTEAEAVKTYAAANGIPCQPRPTDVTQATIAVIKPIEGKDLVDAAHKKEYRGAFFAISIGAILVAIGIFTSLVRKK